jgi:hypothetical protein
MTAAHRGYPSSKSWNSPSSVVRSKSWRVSNRRSASHSDGRRASEIRCLGWSWSKSWSQSWYVSTNKSLWGVAMGSGSWSRSDSERVGQRW